MGKTFGVGVLVLAATFCLLTTWTAATAPAAFAERLGLAVANPGGRNEVRAQYAGFFFAVAVACVAALAGLLPRDSALIVLVVVFGGLIAGRVASLGLDGGVAGYTPTVLALYAVDALGCALSLAALLLDPGR
jgi:uncharacterized iron-regulated membrane protein